MNPRISKTEELNLASKYILTAKGKRRIKICINASASAKAL